MNDSSKDKLDTHFQETQYSSPWKFRQKIFMLLWEYTWLLLCRWTPKPLNSWRLLWLRVFGATIIGEPFVHQRSNISIPWNVTLHNHACLGDGAVVYSLGKVEILADATVAQEAYLCTGTHDFELPARPLQTGKILIEQSAFIGARSFILPGITIKKGAIIGACSVVTHDVPEYTIVAGNPARSIGKLIRNIGL
jgi:putative colanic acid biosynthesis acetyltransferase WcaF